MPQPLQLLVCSEAEADLYAFRRQRERGQVVRIIRGRRCAVRDRCMAEWAAAMQFPYCFEGTWDSWRTSMRELQWPAGTKVLLIATAMNRVLPRAKGDFVELVRGLAELAAGDTDGAVATEIVLQCEPSHMEELKVRLGGVGVSIRAIDQ